MSGHVHEHEGHHHHHDGDDHEGTGSTTSVVQEDAECGDQEGGSAPCTDESCLN